MNDGSSSRDGVARIILVTRLVLSAVQVVLGVVLVVHRGSAWMNVITTAGTAYRGLKPPAGLFVEPFPSWQKVVVSSRPSYGSLHLLPGAGIAAWGLLSGMLVLGVLRGSRRTATVATPVFAVACVAGVWPLLMGNAGVWMLFLDVAVLGVVVSVLRERPQGRVPALVGAGASVALFVALTPIACRVPLWGDEAFATPGVVEGMACWSVLGVPVAYWMAPVALLVAVAGGAAIAGVVSKLTTILNRG